MAANFWDVPHTILRGEALTGDEHMDYSGHHGGFGNDSSWMWSSDCSFDSRPSLLFDFHDGSSHKFHPHSEPVSPSSVATTPTTSEHPVSRTHESHQAGGGNDDDEDEYRPHSLSASRSSVPTHISVSKRQRKGSPVRESTTHNSSGMDRNGRKKKYDAPPGVWRNSGGFISTVYINKKRVYGPLRRDVADAVKDREEMLLAKEVIKTEEGMRSFVQGMKERCGSTRQSITSVDIPLAAAASSSTHSSSAGSYAAAVRVSSRPVRAAAKRNVFAAFGNSSAESVADEDLEFAPTEELEDGYEDDRHLPAGFNAPASHFF